MRLRETTLVLFGNPAAGTPVMAEAPWWHWTSPSVAQVGTGAFAPGPGAC